jgi:hypothetical protein
MTRFDAADATERRKLFADAVTAHRTRASQFLTVEADPASVAGHDDRDDAADAGDDVEAPGADGGGDGTEGAGASETPPWLQFAQDTFNLDCTDAELDRLTSMLDDFPEFRIDELESPDSAEGTNVRITARSDAARLAAFVERTFREVYELPTDYRAWVVQV